MPLYLHGGTRERSELDGTMGCRASKRRQRGLSAHGPIPNRLAGREYRINESRDGEWTVKWLDADGNVVAWFGGDVRLVFVALDHFASRTDSEFGIFVDRVWQREAGALGRNAIVEQTSRGGAANRFEKASQAAAPKISYPVVPRGVQDARRFRDWS